MTNSDTTTGSDGSHGTTHRFRAIRTDLAVSDTDVLGSLDNLRELKNKHYGSDERGHVYDYEDVGHLDQRVCYSYDNDTEQTQSSRWKNLARFGVGWGLSYVVAGLVMSRMASAELTINGEPATIPASGPDLWIGLALVMGLAAVFMLAIQTVPDMAGSRRGGRHV